MVAAALLLVWALDARGAQPPGAFLTRSFGAADGLAGTDVRALALRGLGELLVGTEAGVRRFDGRHFEVLPSPEGFGGTSVEALAVVDAVVYVQTDGGLYKIEDGEATVLDEAAPTTVQSGFTTGADGALYVANGRGVFRVGGSGLDPVVPLGLAPLGWGPRALVEAEDGLWVGGLGGLFHIEGGEVRTVQEKPVRALLPDPGGLLVGREDGLYRANGEEILLLPRCFVTALSRMPDGRVAAACGDGARIGRPGGAWEHISADNGLPGPVATAIAADSDGQVWIGTFGQGLVRLSSLDARLWSRQTGLPSNRVYLTPDGNDGLIVASLGGASRLGTDLVPQALPKTPGAAAEYLSLLRDRTGALYTAHYNAIWRIDPPPVTRIMQTTGIQGELVEGTDRVVYTRDVMNRTLVPLSDTSRPVLPLPEDLGDGRLRMDPEGALVGAGLHGLWRMEGNGSWTRTGDTPTACHTGELAWRGEALWLACSNGVWRLDAEGWVRRLKVDSGLLRDILAVGDEIWVATSDRLYRMAPTPLELGPDRGLPPLGFTPADGHGLARFGGWLLAAVDQGLLWLRPEAFDTVLRPPTPRFASVTLRGQPVADLLALGPEDNFLHVRLANGSLSEPAQTAYRFRLDGDDWSEATAEDQLQLPGLPPGDHTLEVEANRGGGPWSEPVALAFRIDLPWHRRIEVRLGAVGAVLAGLAWAWWGRTKRLRAQLAALQEQQRIRQTFDRFVAPEVAEELLSATRPRMGAENLEVTVLIADLRGFTALSEALGPREVVAMLNIWFSAMVAEIEAEGGMVNKFVGDAVIAVFGAPRALPDHADRAVRAAAAMIRATERLATPLRTRYGHALRAGVGLSSGSVVAGTVGAMSRMEYTVYGQPVNVATRIEAMTRTLDADVLLSDDTVRRLRAPAHISHMGAHVLKGLRDAVELWRLEVPPMGEIPRKPAPPRPAR